MRLRSAKQVLCRFGLLATLATSAMFAAEADAQFQGIVGGAGLSYVNNPSYPICFYVGAGNGFIADAGFSIASATYCVGDSSAPVIEDQTYSLTDNTIYYLYLTQNPLVSSPYPIISEVTPRGNGAPSASLVYAPDGGGTKTTTSAIFIGSVVTNNNSSSPTEIPFARNGSEVILMPNCNGTDCVTPSQSSSQEWFEAYLYGNGFDGPPVAAGVRSYTLSSTTAGGGSTTLYFGDAGTSAPLALPASASAMVADVTTVSNATLGGSIDPAGTGQTFFFLSPWNETITYATNSYCRLYPQFEAIAAPPGVNNVLEQDYTNPTPTSARVHLQTSGKSPVTAVPIGWCEPPPQGNATVWVTYRGYVEHVAHIGYND
jgi:hypothetical protein